MDLNTLKNYFSFEAFELLDCENYKNIQLEFSKNPENKFQIFNLEKNFKLFNQK